MIGGHHHHDGGAKLLGLACAGDGDVGGEMADRHDHRDAAVDMFKAQAGQMGPLGIGNQELFRKVRQNADAVTALIDHAVDHPPHAVIIDGTSLGERGRRYRPDAGIRTGGHGLVVLLGPARQGAI